MTGRKLLLTSLFALGCLVVPTSCTDVGLYQYRVDPFQENKLTVSGTVCSDDPRQRNFPVKVLFVIDTSSPLADDANDPVGNRGKAASEVITLWSKFPNYSFGIIGYGARITNHIEGGFTRDTSQLDAAAAAVQSSSGGCAAGRCRDLQGAIGTASSVITGDILAADPGEVARTSYVLVLFSAGPPVPAIGRCACRDLDIEAVDWPACPWTECDNCEVTCPNNSTCDGSDCYPICDPPCRGNEYCDSDFSTCIDAESVTTRPTVPAEGSAPAINPDTFSHWTLPADITKYGLDPAQLPGTAACGQACVFAAGGHADSCEERQLVGMVRELSDFARKNGAAQLQVHSTYLPDRAPHVSGSQFRPDPCDCNGTDCADQAAEARSVRLLSEMAYAGNGGFRQFNVAEEISYRHVDLFAARDPLVIKELVVTNGSLLPGQDGLAADSDQDGLDDQTERGLGTCHADPDTDGDGIGDAIEVKLAQDPLSADDPIECVDLLTSLRSDTDLCTGQPKDWTVFEDKDGDTLNTCEERLLGTEDSLYDTDADGIPDKLELVYGTNYFAVDPLDDADLDGILNRDEIRGHTDPRANDAQTQLDLAYRYEEVDEGVKTIITVSQPPTVTGVTIKNASPETQLGVGMLRFEPGPPPTLSWKSPGDTGPGGDFGIPVDISDATAEGYEIPSQNGNSVTVAVDGSAYYSPVATVDRIVVSSAERNCLRFRVRNITLMQTEDAWYAGPGATPVKNAVGDNVVYLYFAQAPKGAKDGYGIFRVASVVLNYQVGPPETRTPREAELTFTDDDFILFE